MRGWLPVTLLALAWLPGPAHGIELPAVCGTTVRLKVGEHLELRLPAQASAGFLWQGTVVGGGMLVGIETTGRLESGPDQRDGGPAIQTFRILGRGPGEGQVRFVHKRGFDKEATAARECIVRVVVG